ncbi:MAG: isocitrate/isopropylmalate family dehydrogenase, partial [Gammaproteobacteria bacterium]|nr:isocitrate/isopropylmalate family dehydrogenase [Gammaproteobacteria bacterium]
MKHYKVAAIPGDGIGTEVISAGVEVLQHMAEKGKQFTIEVETFPWGADYYFEHGQMMPDDGRDALKKFDAILFGSAGDPRIPDHITLWQLRLNICQGFEQYANVRPSRVLPGVKSPLAGIGPGDFDWVIVRENSEGEYAGVGGRAHRDFPEEVAMDVSVFTRAGVERIQRFALDLARSRPRKQLT